MMFQVQMIKLGIIAFIITSVLILLNMILSILLSIMAYILGTIIIVAIGLVVFIPEVRWINGAIKALKFSKRIEEKINNSFALISKIKVNKITSTVNSTSNNTANRF